MTTTLTAAQPDVEGPPAVPEPTDARVEPAPAEPADGTPRPVTAEEFRRMCEAEVFGPGARVELLEGTIRHKMSQSPIHIFVVNRLIPLFAAVGRRAVLHVQSSAQVNDLGVPEPDFVLLRGPDERYATRWATPADMLLLVEVARTSLDYDRDEKRPVYAREGVAEFWLVDVVRREVWVHRDPAAGGYREVRALAADQRLRCAALPEISFAVDDLFPAEPAADRTE